jgi:hypothetical protein
LGLLWLQGNGTGLSYLTLQQFRSTGNAGSDAATHRQLQPCGFDGFQDVLIVSHFNRSIAID